MGEVCQNDIETMMNLYEGLYREENKLIECVVENYLRSRIGYVYVPWSERQQMNILRQFEHIMSKQEEVRDEIHCFYMVEISIAEDEELKILIKEDYTFFVKLIWLRPPEWLRTIERCLPYIGEIPQSDILLPVFDRILTRMRNCYKNIEHMRPTTGRSL